MKLTRYRKILAVILSLFMIMTVCPLTAFAADGDDVTYMAVPGIWKAKR